MLGHHDVGIEYDRWACATRRAAGYRTIEMNVSHCNPHDYGERGLIGSPPMSSAQQRREPRGSALRRHEAGRVRQAGAGAIAARDHASGSAYRMGTGPTSSAPVDGVRADADAATVARTPRCSSAGATTCGSRKLNATNTAIH